MQFSDAVLPYLDDAYDLARWLTRDRNDAEDVVQEAYSRAFKFFDGSKSTNPRAWILTIVRNSFYTWLKDKRAHEAEPLLEDAVGHPDSPYEPELWDPDQISPETALSRKDDDNAVRMLIEALPVQFREALVLREFDELSYQEIAEITAVPIGTVMSRLARARRLLQTAWQERQKRECDV